MSLGKMSFYHFAKTIRRHIVLVISGQVFLLVLNALLTFSLMYQKLSVGFLHRIKRF